MGLETAVYVSDLLSTNPLPGDNRSVGDDHLRLIKAVLQSTFPNASRAEYFDKYSAKTANFVIVAADMRKVFGVSAATGNVSSALPTLAAGNDGWRIQVTKTDDSANTVTLTGTVNGETDVVLTKQYETVNFLWTGTAWLAFRPLVYREGTVLLPIGTTATRPATAKKGALWYNDTLSSPEFFNGTDWFSLMTGLSGAQMPYGAIINGSFTVVENSPAGNAMTFALKTLAGTDPSTANPVLIAFRSATGATGNYVYRTVTAPLSFVLTSGSAMGVSAINTAFRLWHVLFDDGGTIRWGVINCLSEKSVYPLGRTPLASSTAEGGLGGADAAHTFYTGTAVAAKPYVILGYSSFENGLATVGAWAALPTYNQLFGSGVPLPGSRIQSAETRTGAFSSGSTVIPDDNSIPQITEGDEYMTCSFISTSKANLLNVEALAYTANTNNVTNTMALFNTDVHATNALAAMSGKPAAASPFPISLDWTQLAPLAAASTWRVRLGGNAGTLNFNGWGGGGVMLGTVCSFLRVTEIMV